jgi:hypothetical protein
MIHRGPRRRSPARPLLGLAAALLIVASAGACGDDPFQVDWQLRPDTVLLYSLARPELNLVSAFNFNRRTTVRIEAPSATGTWDLALDTQGGELVFLTPGAVGVPGSRARIIELPGVTFDEIREAPADTASYVSDEPVQVTTGLLYVVQTNETAGGFGRRCVYYAKLEPLEADPVAGTLRFRFDASPVCNDRSLVPPEN